MTCTSTSLIDTILFSTFLLLGVTRVNYVLHFDLFGEVLTRYSVLCALYSTCFSPLGFMYNGFW